LQTPSRNTRLEGIFTARSWRPRKPHSELSNTLCTCQAAAFVLSMFKINDATRSSRRSQCLHSVSTAIHSVAGHCSARTSAICSFFNTVETLGGRRTGLSGLLEKLFIMNFPKHLSVVSYRPEKVKTQSSK